MNTRPPSNDPADIAKWTAEREAEGERLRDEREFREEMREAAGDTKARLTWLADAIEKHSRDDNQRFDALEQRFGPVNQSISETSNKLAWILGSVAGIVGIVGLGATLWGMLK